MSILVSKRRNVARLHLTLTCRPCPPVHVRSSFNSHCQSAKQNSPSPKYDDFTLFDLRHPRPLHPCPRSAKLAGFSFLRWFVGRDEVWFLVHQLSDRKSNRPEESVLSQHQLPHLPPLSSSCRLLKVASELLSSLLGYGQGSS